MANTYAINVTRNKEFEVERELRALGLNPWVPRRLMSKKITQKKERTWYDVAYVPKLLFAVFPAVYWNDVIDIKDIIGKPIRLSRADMVGRKACVIERRDGTSRAFPASWGLSDFRDAVEREYDDAQRLKSHNLYQCEYRPGQAIEILSGAFAGMPAAFTECVQKAHQDYATLRVEVEMMGRTTEVDIAPDLVRSFV